MERELFTPRVTIPQPAALAVAPQVPAPAPANPAAYLDVLMDIRDEIEEPQTAAAPQGKVAAMMASIGAAFRERRLVAVSAVALVALPLIGLGVATAMKANRGGWVTQTSYAEGLPARDSVIPTTTVADAGRLAPIAVIPDASKDSAARAAGASTATKARVEHAPARRTEEPVIQLADVPRTAVGRLDSVVRAINVPSARVGQSFQVQMQASLEDAQRASVAELRSNIPARSTKLIGAAPVPTYPYALARSGIGGEVRVRFEVDTLGRPVMGTFTVVRSPHARFSESVKKVIPAMRFEPARGPGPSARTISETVEMTFTFAPQPSGP
jgi:TonB family protein